MPHDVELDPNQAGLLPLAKNGHYLGFPDCSRTVAVQKSPVPTEEFLANIPLFQELPKADIQRIAARTAAIDAPRGTVLFERGDSCRGFHVVVYGRVQLVLQSDRGNEKIVAFMGRGQTFGEAVMFLDETYLVTARTIDDSKLLHVDRESVFEEISRDPHFARKMLAGLSRRLHRLMLDVESYTLRSGTQRVIGYLMRDYAGNDGTNAMTVNLEAPKGAIASRLNLTQEHFSRILHQLANAGLIEVVKRNIRVPDVERLRTYNTD